MEHIDQPRQGLTGRLTDVMGALKEFFVTGRRKRQEPIVDQESLARFLDQRASYVAQMSLYGYLRTRAGVRYFELFHNDEFIVMLNVAKWHVWLDCLSDLAVYSGGLLHQRSGTSPQKVGKVVGGAVSGILKKTGVPADSGKKYSAHAERVRKRLDKVKWAKVTDDEGPFSESPMSVVEWAPIIETLKELDQSIVINSVRFRWQEIRRALREHLDAEAVMRSK
ncbi:MAG: esterase [Pseudomonadota bacterium]|nr:esterase [Pseudomonadota bacterium]